MKKAKKNPAEDVIPESCYVDHAIVSMGAGRMSFMAAYTPVGLMRMEAGLREVVFDCCTTTELEGIRVQIRKNKHLHPRIKAKLLAQADIIARPTCDRYHDMKDYPGSWWPRRLTQQGIRQIDAEFCRRIMSMRDGQGADAIKRDIEKNEHICQEIKDNLLGNLAMSVEAFERDRA